MWAIELSSYLAYLPFLSCFSLHVLPPARRHAAQQAKSALEQRLLCKFCTNDTSFCNSWNIPPSLFFTPLFSDWNVRTRTRGIVSSAEPKSFLKVDALDEMSSTLSALSLYPIRWLKKSIYEAIIIKLLRNVSSAFSALQDTKLAQIWPHRFKARSSRSNTLAFLLWESHCASCWL